MRGAMIRNTRAVVALKLPRRHATTIKVDGGAGEAEAYADLAAAARRLAAEGGAGRERLALHHLLSAAGSSPDGRCSARSLGSQRDMPAIRPGLNSPSAGRRSARAARRRRSSTSCGRNPTEKKLVFVHSRETLAHLADRLAEAGVALRALRRQPERAGEGRRHRRVSRPCAGPAVHASRAARGATSSSAIP